MSTVKVSGYYESASQFNHMWNKWETHMWLMDEATPDSSYFEEGTEVDAIVHY